ncbi:MAG: hypothetical protein RIQ60_311 [Pseudomonadota bacterium]|jgi:hypothetical protein
MSYSLPSNPLRPRALTGLALLGALLALAGCSQTANPCLTADGMKDEAMCVGRDAKSLAGAEEDYFADMDYGASKNPDAVAASLQAYVPGIKPADAVKAVVMGRNNWNVWTAGNDRLWDQLASESRGSLDFLKVLSNHPSLKASRDNRWNYLGVVNEPCFNKSAGPREDRFGLWLDLRDAACPADPFENEQKYPGVKIGSRGDAVPVGSYYGYATGVVGLRLFPNPAFDAAAKKKWDPVRYYTDPSYYNDKDLVRPYRVGMSCGFCHVGPNPSRPPADPEHPKWENLNSNPGAQYFWVDRIFSAGADPSNFAFQLFHTSRPGALDTSFISSDYINNPRTMNAVYNVGARLALAEKFGLEKLAGGSADNVQFPDVLPPDSPLAKLAQKPDKTWSPRVLKDGSDSVGALGALNRVYINIGMYSEEWTRHFRPLVGGKKISPIEIKSARANSSYWRANEAQTPNLALFFLATAKPDKLADAPGGTEFLSKDDKQLELGKQVFAENCAGCHSSKLPDKAYTFLGESCVGANYLKCWDDYWKYVRSDEFKQPMKVLVSKPDFLDNNFLSIDQRVPVTLLQTNICSPIATNALAGNIWDNFSSQSYKELPAVGSVKLQHPMTGEVYDYELPGGGRGFTRPASLVSVWSTAPFLLNNTVGPFLPSGSVADRMKSFDASIEQMLWPEKREGNVDVVTGSGKKIRGRIDVTSQTSYLSVPGGYLPDIERPLQGVLERWLPAFFGDGGVKVGPIPKGTPINLISNVNLDKPLDAIGPLLKVKAALKDIPQGASDEDAIRIFREHKAADELLKVSKCPDFVVNRGHYFGTSYLSPDSQGLSDDEKKALIAFIKTF